MSKRETILRYSIIIKKLRKRPATFKEISDYLALESELQDYDFNISKRTFQRDLKDILSIYNIDIKFDYSKQVYFIDFEDKPDIGERLLEAFDVLHSVNMADRLSDFVQFEHRRPQGTENMYGLIHAVKNKQEVRFNYQKYWEDDVVLRQVEPYLVKEFKYRWYVLGKDVHDKNVKVFALDRLGNLEYVKKYFQIPSDFNPNKLYRHCFGIIVPNGEAPEDIVLSFDPFQGKYIKSLHLHHSQEIIKDDGDELIVKLKLFITHDLVMELLSYGDNVKVIEPLSLIEKMKVIYENSLKQYET